MKIFRNLVHIVFVIILAALPFADARAVFPVIDVGPQNITLWSATAVNTTAMAVAVGIPGTGAVVTGAAKAAQQACKGIDVAEKASLAADTFSNFSLIGGSGAESAAIQKKIVSLTLVKTCREAELTALSSVPSPSLIVAQDLVRRQSELNAEIATLSTRIEDLNARMSASVKDVLKAVAVKMVSNLSQNMTTSLVNNMVQKYKISNYLTYANAVANQVYVTDYVRNNYQGNMQDQMIIRSMLNNDKVAGELLPMVRLKAQDSLGFVPTELSISDPNYLEKAAEIGSGKANPYFIDTVLAGEAQNAQAYGKKVAEQEIAQSKGFIPPRNCGGSVALQKQNDAQRAAAEKEYNINLIVSQKLVQARAMNPQSVDQKEVETAAANLSRSKDKLKSLTTDGTEAFVEICQGINNPGGFVADSISGYLNSNLNNSMNVKTENMPFWATFLSNIGTNFVNNIISGRGSNDQLLKETAFQTTNLAINDIVGNIGEAQKLKGSSEAIGQFMVHGSSNASDEYVVEWDASNVPAAASVLITGPGLALNRNTLSGSAAFKTTTGGRYVISLKDKDGKSLNISDSYDLKVPVLVTVPTIPQQNLSTQTANFRSTFPVPEPPPYVEESTSTPDSFR